ncbi:MAG: carbonic anhydrase [Rhodoferax sp.]|uniref:carbonic anhydrase n=1 Tax=Rhodoferax sp. TaxID=50421 RepID=UPI0014001BEC|nr:carbonic anhydrase [Rhodoferax sp.]NDP39835.1 carbonic anhydrase [Rhodoferax sp.]
MCFICDERLSSRRGFLSVAAYGALTGFVLPAAPAFAAGGAVTALSADEALAKLKAGNEKYVNAPELCSAQLGAQREHVAKSQAPWATIISCADSRVPPELLFGGLGVGELFVARNAGNMVDTATMGTIEYGAAVLGVPLIVVLGHERCGAASAACEVVEKKTKFPASIGPMVDAIVPAALAVVGKPGDFVDNTIRESAIRTARKITTESSIVAELVKNGKVKVIAARYDLDDGRVEYFS